MTRVLVAEAAGLDRHVGGLEQDRQRCLVHDPRLVEERRQRAVLGGQLLLAEDEQRQVDRRLDPAGLELPRQLEQDSEPALHVARAQPDDGAVLDSAGKVVLRRNGVVVAGEDDQVATLPARRGEHERVLAAVLGRERGRDERDDVRGDLGLVTAFGGDVHELERPLGQPVGERWHRPQAWHNPLCDDEQARHPRRGRGARAGVRGRRAREGNERRGRARRAPRAGSSRPACSRRPSSCSSARIPIRGRTSARASWRS